MSLNFSKRDAAISADVYNEQSSFDKDSPVQRLNEEQLKEKELDKLTLNDDESGFKSAIYYDSERDEYIYAFAGSELSIKDWGANFSEGVGEFSRQHELAVLNTSVIKGKISGLRLTGHSLGGGLASLASVSNGGLRTTTFNAAGLHAKTIRDNGGDLRYSSSVSAYYVEGEALTYGQQNSHTIPNKIGVNIMIPKTRVLIAIPFTPYRGFQKLVNGGQRSRMHSIGDVQKSLESIGND